MGNGGTFPDTGTGRAEMLDAWVTHIGISSWMMHWLNSLLHKGEPLFFRALEKVKRTIPASKRNKVQYIFLYVNVHKNLCGIHRYATAAIISIQCPKKWWDVLLTIGKMFKVFDLSWSWSFLFSITSDPTRLLKTSEASTFIFYWKMPESHQELTPGLINASQHSFVFSALREGKWKGRCGEATREP